MKRHQNSFKYYNKVCFYKGSVFHYRNPFLKKWAILGLFFVYFCLFWTNITILTSNKCEKCPSSIWCWDSNLQPSEHESPPITTRPGVIIVIHDMPKSYQFIPPEDMNVHEEKHQYVHSNIYFLFLFISIFYSLILIILIYCCWLSLTFFQS